MKQIIPWCMLMLMSTTYTHEMQSIKKVLDATSDVTFGTFCEFIAVPIEQKNEFALYYENQTKKIKRVRSSATRQARAQELRDKGRSALEVEEPQLFAEFKSCEAGTIVCASPRACVAQNARLFLTRYGAWHEFKKSHAQSQVSMWAKVKDFARSGKQRVAQWFGPREEVQVALNQSK